MVQRRKGETSMNMIKACLGLAGLVIVVVLAGCDDRSESKTKHRSLADAAAQLRSDVTIDTTSRGHVTWNGNAQILKESDCYLLAQDYVLVGRGGGVMLRLIYRAERPGVLESVDFTQPLLVELQLDRRRYDGSHYRAEPPAPGDAEITTEAGLTFGSARLPAAQNGARRGGPEGVTIAFEFHCS